MSNKNSLTTNLNSNKLTNYKQNKLCNHTDVKFSFVMSNHCIEKAYRFDRKEKDNNQKFINKMIEYLDCSWEQMKELYFRIPDKNDKIDDKQVYHIALGNKMRVHGYEAGGLFVVTRFDPNHDFHD